MAVQRGPIVPIFIVVAALVCVSLAAKVAVMTKVLPSDPAPGDNFGVSIGVSGNKVVIGALSTNATVANEGGAYVYACETNNTAISCVEQKKLTASDGTPQARFGYVVAISGQNFVVGSDNATVQDRVGQGSAYVWSCSYDSEPWQCSEQAVLVSDDGAAGDRFGYSVAIDGDIVVVGADRKTIEGRSQQGAVYVFNCTSSGGTPDCTQLVRLNASDGAAGDRFGVTLAVSGTTVFVGAGFHTFDGKVGAGAVYEYACQPNTEEGAAWVCDEYKITAADAAASDGFGRSLSISSNLLVIGATTATVSGRTGQGAAYLFYCPETGGCDQRAKMTASDGQGGDQFGRVGISNGIVISGAPEATVGENLRQGAAYVFNCTNCDGDNGNDCTCTEIQKFAAPDGGAGDSFGRVGLQGNILGAGARGFDGPAGQDQGAAYIWALVDGEEDDDDDDDGGNMASSIAMASWTHWVVVAVAALILVLPTL